MRAFFMCGGGGHGLARRLGRIPTMQTQQADTMPEKEVHNYALWWQTIVQATVFTGIGVLIAMGQMLQSRDPITWRVAIGRCITTGGIALVAGSALAFFPNIPFIAQVGIAAMLASLGNSGLEMLIHRMFNR